MFRKRAVFELIWYGRFSSVHQSVKFDRVCRTFVELNLGSRHGASEPVLKQWKKAAANQQIHLNTAKCYILEYLPAEIKVILRGSDSHS